MMGKKEFAVFLIKPVFVGADAYKIAYKIESAYMDYCKPKLTWELVEEADLFQAMTSIDEILEKDYGVKAVFQLENANF